MSISIRPLLQLLSITLTLLPAPFSGRCAPRRMTFAAAFVLLLAPTAAMAQGHYAGRMAGFGAEEPITEADVVMLGNSLTEFGGDWQARLPWVSGRVRNRGIAGDDTRGITRRLRSVTQGHPKAILLECGINDISHGLDAQTVARRLCKLIDRIRRQSPRTVLIVQSLTPINESTRRWKLLDGRSGDIPRVNAIVRDHCRARGVAYIDLYRALDTDHTGVLPIALTTDGLHLSEAGYALWQRELERKARAIINGGTGNYQ